MNYKLNRYLYTTPKKEIMLIYNLLDNCIFAISKEKYKLLTGNDLESIEIDNPTLFRALFKLGVIVPTDFNEIDAVKMKNRAAIFDMRRYRLTINPTLECNFRCWYCYEKHPHGKMSKSIMQALINHIKLKIEDKSLQHLSLDWFGGEPLLYFEEVVLPLSKAIKHLVDKSGISMTSCATTNGYLIDEKCIKLFQEIGLNHFQITLDGNEQQHNKIRYGKNKVASFKTIMNNINLLSEYPEFTILVRINYIKETLAGINDIIEFFSENAKKKITVLFQQVWQDSVKKYVSADKNKKVFEKNGINVHKHELNLNGSVCYADYLQQAVINFDGRVFKCTARDFNTTKEDGLLLEDGNIQWNIPMLSKRLGNATFENEFCINCNLLPVCMGPCSQKMVEFKKEKNFKQFCLQGGIESIIKQNIENFYKDIQKKQQ
jgi:uncharacterized protein